MTHDAADVPTSTSEATRACLSTSSVAAMGRLRHSGAAHCRLTTTTHHASLAQQDRAPVYDAGGRWFNSSAGHHTEGNDHDGSPGPERGVRAPPTREPRARRPHAPPAGRRRRGGRRRAHLRALPAASRCCAWSATCRCAGATGAGSRRGPAAACSSATGTCAPTAAPAARSTVDHVLPRSRGGASSWLNTVAACLDCNHRKRDRTPQEAGMRLRSSRTSRPTGSCSHAERRAAARDHVPPSLLCSPRAQE